MSPFVALLTVVCAALAALCRWRARETEPKASPAGDVSSPNASPTAPENRAGPSPGSYRFAGLAALCFALYHVAAVDTLAALIMWVMVALSGRTLPLVGARLSEKRYGGALLYCALPLAAWVLYWASVLTYRCTC